jgi:ribosomal protein L11 methyltransferase
MRTEEVEINMTNWQELTIHVHRDAEEAVSNLMIETGSQLLHPV